jgi:hypothetical protein
VKLDAQEDNNHNNQDISNQAGLDTRTVVGGIFRAENRGANDAANRTPADEGGGGERTLPLATNIVAALY